MSGRNTLGFILSIIGAILGIVVTPIFFVYLYEPMIAGEIAIGTPSGLGCALVVEFIFPFISDIGIIAGGLYLVAGIGFLQNDKRAFTIAIIANVLALQSGFWPIVPAIITNMPPLFALVFLVNLIIYFLLMGPVGRHTGKTTLVGLFVGMAWVLSFMNGVAATNRIVAVGWPLFTAMQRVNWIASALFGVAVVGIVLRPEEWVRKIGLLAAILEISAGYPTGFFSPFEGFSLFLLAPMFSTALLVIFVSPKIWDKLFGKRLAKMREVETLVPK